MDAEMEARALVRHVLKNRMKAMLVGVGMDDAIAGLAIASGEYLAESATTEDELTDLLEVLVRGVTAVARTWGHGDGDFPPQGADNVH